MNLPFRASSLRCRLYLAFFTLLASVIVTIIMTYWQIQVARELDHNNDKQQQKYEALLSNQLKAQEKLIDQKTIDTNQLQELIKFQVKREEKLNNTISSMQKLLKNTNELAITKN